ncbi:unnamed protein product, partial [Closterium sp. NIES-65]
HGYGQWSDIINDDKLGLADVACAELSLPPVPPRNMIGLTLEDIPAVPPAPSPAQPTNPGVATTKPADAPTNPADAPTRPGAVTINGGDAMGETACVREERRAERKAAEAKAASAQEGAEGDGMTAGVKAEAGAAAGSHGAEGGAIGVCPM